MTERDYFLAAMKQPAVREAVQHARRVAMNEDDSNLSDAHERTRDDDRAP